MQRYRDKSRAVFYTVSLKLLASRLSGIPFVLHGQGHRQGRS